jgi:hypothetical protein
MTRVHKLMMQGAIVALVGVGVLATMAAPASAYVVCNRFGDCWHTDHRYHWDRDLRVEVHPDDWYFHRDWDNDRDRHWRAWHEGRGYWRNGVWIQF